MKQTRILVADDHENVRLVLRTFIRTFPSLELVGEATNGQEAVALCNTLQPDVVLMDVTMPRMDGVTALRHIHQSQPAVRVIALSGVNDPITIQTMLKEGAAGYVLKSDSYDELAAVLGVADCSIEQPLVLVAEDDPNLRSLFAKVLKSNGFQVSLATNGQDAVTLIEQHLPDVVILDLGMPQFSGFDLIRFIRQHEGDHHVFIVIVTGNHNAQELPEAELADLFLLKPVSTRDLTQFVQRFLGE